MNKDYFNSRSSLKTSKSEFTIFSLNRLESAGLGSLTRLPFSLRVILESLVRLCNNKEVTEQDVAQLVAWQPKTTERLPLPFYPGRVVMQDFTGVPAVVDLAAMRSAMARLGGNPQLINPSIPVDLVIDHSIQVDFFASPDAFQRNTEIEFERNRERYEFLRWGQQAFSNFRVVPPAMGIVHQVNLEYIADVVMEKTINGKRIAFPDTLLGTDSHTTMINGLGVLGWGVGGIEAEAAMLGQPVDMLTPDVIGFRLFGVLAEGVTATDLTLTVVQMLRKKGVVGKFVEFYGPGLSAISLPDRATIANMAPEYGATIGFFPVDDETLHYLRLTGRPVDVVERVEAYCKEQGLFRTDETTSPEFTDTLELDLNTVETSLAGPKRPQDRIPLTAMKSGFRASLVAPKISRGFELSNSEVNRKVLIGTNGNQAELKHGSIVIAAITSCTNTSNPSVMIGAGLIAKKAIERGLKVKPFVKTSLAPGSRVVTQYLEKAGLLEPLASLGFNLVGYGCTTCIGNSGPLAGEIVKAITSSDLVVAAVLSGNRNFEGRIHPYVKANYLASPMLVVAYALAGNVDVDLVNDPLGTDLQGNQVYLRDLWPTNSEIQSSVDQSVNPDMFCSNYADVFCGNEMWNNIPIGDASQYHWDEHSTYIQDPPFFTELSRTVPHIASIIDARALVVLGDSITTDHISPAGTIQVDSPAGKYLLGQGVPQREFNSYGSRRGNDRVMTRGTFANIRLKNKLAGGLEGGITMHLPDGKITSIFEAALQYRNENVPLIVIAGEEYGSGSSRDWAAKGTLLLGVKAVLARSFERIHRSNLVGMGILPLQFVPGESSDSLGLTGNEAFTIRDLDDSIQPHAFVTINAQKEIGERISFKAIARLDTVIEVNYYRNGGILPTIVRKLL